MVSPREENFIHSNGAWAVAGVFAFTGMAVQIYNIRKHLVYFTNKRFQLWILRILLIVPIYCLHGFISMKFPALAKYLEIFTHIYDAIVIYSLFMLCLEYVGGEMKFISHHANTNPMRQPFPFCCFKPLNLDERFIRRCKQYTLQFVIVKPLMVALSIILIIAGLFESDVFY